MLQALRKMKKVTIKESLKAKMQQIQPLVRERMTKTRSPKIPKRKRMMLSQF
jgi:hypothetical protein